MYELAIHGAISSPLSNCHFYILYPFLPDGLDRQVVIQVMTTVQIELLHARASFVMLLMWPKGDKGSTF